MGAAFTYEESLPLILDRVDVVADDEGRPVELLRLPDEGRGFRLKNE
jgi:hypothetical protein